MAYLDDIPGTDLTDFFVDMLLINKKIAELCELSFTVSDKEVLLAQDWPEYGFVLGQVFDVSEPSLSMKALAIDLMAKHHLVRDYEPYDCLGMHWHCHDSDNPVVTLEDFQERSIPEMPAPFAIFCAIVTGQLPPGECVA